LINVISNYDELFQEPTEFPPKREVEHKICLQQDAPFLNIGMYRSSVIENAEIKKQVHELLDKGIIKPISSPIQNCNNFNQYFFLLLDDKKFWGVYMIHI